MNQGMQVDSGSWEKQENGSSLRGFQKEHSLIYRQNLLWTSDPQNYKVIDLFQPTEHLVIVAVAQWNWYTSGLSFCMTANMSHTDNNQYLMKMNKYLGFVTFWIFISYEIQYDVFNSHISEHLRFI